MRFFRNAASLLLTSAVMMPLGMLTSILLARLLPVDELGFYSVSLNFASLAVIFAGLGVAPASIYRIRRVQSDPARVLTAASFVMLAVGVLVIAGCVIFRDQIVAHFLAGTPSLVFLLAVATIPIDLLGKLLGGVARGIDRFRYQNWHNLARTVGSLLVIAVVLGALGRGLPELMASVLALRLVTTGILFVVVARETGFARRIDFREITEAAGFGIKSYAEGLAVQIHESIDIFMIAYLLGDPAQVAYYTIATRIVERLRQGPRAIGATLFPKIAGAPKSDAAAFTAYVARQSVFWAALSAFVLGITAPFLLPLLYGEAYGVSVIPFQILLLAVVLLTISHVVSRYFASIAQQEIAIAGQLTSAILNVGLNLWWIPTYGIAGAASASLLSYTLGAVVVVAAFCKSTEARLLDLLIIRRKDFQAYQANLRPCFYRILGRGPSQSHRS